MTRLIKIFFFVSILFGSGTISAQTPSITKPRLDLENFYTYEAIENKIEGKVYVKFQMNYELELLEDSIIVVKSLGYGLDSIAIEIVKGIKKWNPPMDKNLLIKTSGFETYTLPINFFLTDISYSEWAQYYVKKGDKQFEKNEFDKALECYIEAKNKFKANPNIYYGLAKVYKAKGEIKLSDKYFRKAKKIESYN